VAAVVIPIVCLAAIVAVLGLAIRAPMWPPRRVTSWVGRTRTPEERRAVEKEIRDRLDDRAFGADLARRAWAAVAGRDLDDGLIQFFHRDYCGHGLIRTAEGVKLCEIQDGFFPGPAEAEWRSQDEFVAFFARQSDYTCSGWDPAEPVFFTTDSWRRCNQRLTRDGIERFLSGKGGKKT